MYKCKNIKYRVITPHQYSLAESKIHQVIDQGGINYRLGFEQNKVNKNDQNW